MESWCVGFDGNDDVERHAGIEISDTSRPALRLRIVSDYICPWCYIGFTRIEQLRSEFDIDLEAGAYELRPGIPPEGASREALRRRSGREYPAGYMEHLAATAADAGIEMKRPELVPNTRLAHEATEFATSNGKLWEIHRALFHAYFEEERNIGDIEVLCDIGAAIGLDADGLRAALTDRRYAQLVEQQLEWARAAGITGVPTAIFNEKFALVGAQDYDAVRDIARRIANGALERTDDYDA